MTILTGPNSDEALYPEHEKMKGIADQSQAIGEFLETTDYTLMEWDETSGEYISPSKTIEQILADHFEIDLAKVEQEKRAMLRGMADD